MTAAEITPVESAPAVVVTIPTTPDEIASLEAEVERLLRDSRIRGVTRAMWKRFLEGVVSTGNQPSVEDLVQVRDRLLARRAA